MQEWNVRRELPFAARALEQDLPQTTARQADLLTAGPLILPTDRAGMAEALTSTYRVRGVDFADSGAGLVGLANRIDLDEVTLHYCRYEVETTVRFPAMAGFRQFFCLSGSGLISERGRTIEVNRGGTGIVPPDSRFEAVYSAGYRHLVVQMSEEALCKKHALLEGEPQNGLNLPLFETLSMEQAWRLRDTAMGLAARFDAGHAANRVLTAELEQALLTAFLIDNGVSGSAPRVAGARAAGFRDLRRLEDYIHAHWDEPLTVAAVADACGMSVRSVFARMKEARGCSPLSYVREIRLNRARDLLLDPEPEFSVMDAAIRCGFASFGHFARRYRERFGELPSETLGLRRTPASRA